MRDVTKGLTSLLATLGAQKSRGWAAHNELDYFTLCPTCGHWFDCRNPESLIKHRHPTTSIVVTTIVASGQVIQQDAPSNVAVETPNLLPKTATGGAKT